MRPRVIKQKALKLRLKGHSYNEIKFILGIPKSTLATWFSNLVLSEKTWNKILKKGREQSIKRIIERNKKQTPLAIERALKIRKKAQQEINKLTKRDLLILGASLYWAEGYKKPITINGQIKTFHPISFANSDPYLIQLFLRFIREICQVPENKIKIQIMGYKHQNPKYLKDYWKKVTKLKEKNFNQIYFGVSKSSLGKKPFNNLQFGTIQVRINNTNLYNKIMGWIESLKKFSIQH